MEDGGQVVREESSVSCEGAAVRVGNCHLANN